MSESFAQTEFMPNFALWEQLQSQRVPLSFDIEITARCNNDCRHCYINLPAGDPVARSKELALDEIIRIAKEGVSLGAMWCLITGGEPLLRRDFADIYTALKRLGLLVSVFTNATAITPKHVELFKEYPPHDLEVTVYGVRAETYERVSRRPGTFAAFRRGLDLLLEAHIPVRLKAMAIQSNASELAEIARFCREHTKDYFKFDTLLHMRYDGDLVRNAEIGSERLSPERMVEVERTDPEHYNSLKNCKPVVPSLIHTHCDHLFHCGAGRNSFSVTYDGIFRLCSSLHHPDTLYDLRKGTLKEAWEALVPAVRDMRSNKKEFLENCRICPLINLCLACPANAYLETHEMDNRVEYFCRVAEARAKAVGSDLKAGGPRRATSRAKVRPEMAG